MKKKKRKISFSNTDFGGLPSGHYMSIIVFIFLFAALRAILNFANTSARICMKLTRKIEKQV